MRLLRALRALAMVLCALAMTFVVAGAFIPPSTVSADEGAARALFFYSADCEECLEMMDRFMPRLTEKYGPQFEVKYLDILEYENYELMSMLEERYGEAEHDVPVVFVDEQVLSGEREVEAKLEDVVRQALLKGGSAWPEPAPAVEGKEVVKEKFEQLGVLAVLGGGLLDGVNPCAFTVLVFLVSYLFFVGRSGRDVLLLGSIFTIGVFVAYFLIGIGLLGAVTKLAILPLLSRILSYLIAAIVLALGVVSIYDYFQIKKGRMEDVKLHLSQRLKWKIQSAIRDRFSMKTHLLGTFSLGFIVALYEFPCTGQVYFPIVLVIRNVPGLRLHGLWYLVLYNLMFILPLIVVFGLAYFGMSSERLAAITRRNVGKVKLLTAAFFFFLAGLILLFIRWIH